MNRAFSCDVITFEITIYLQCLQYVLNRTKCGVTSWYRSHSSLFLIYSPTSLPTLYTPSPSHPFLTPPSCSLSPLKQVAVEAMDKKTFDLSSTVQMDPPDLKRLQLLLQGSISTQAREPSYTIFVGDYMRWTRLCLSICRLVARHQLAVCHLL